MLPFEARISEELKDSMRAKDQVKSDCLRAMKSALKYKSVEKAQAEVSEAEAIQVFQTMIKQRRDSAEQFEKFDRKEQAQKELREIEIIMSYLPQQLSEADLKKMISEAIAKTGAKSAQDMGKVMGEIKSKVQGRAEGKVVADLVRAALAS